MHHSAKTSINVHLLEESHWKSPA